MKKLNWLICHRMLVTEDDYGYYQITPNNNFPNKFDLSFIYGSKEDLMDENIDLLDAVIHAEYHYKRYISH